MGPTQSLLASSPKLCWCTGKRLDNLWGGSLRACRISLYRVQSSKDYSVRGLAPPLPQATLGIVQG